MNKDQFKGTVKNIAGKVQQETGRLIGSKEQQAKGQLKQMLGRAEKRVGDAEEVIKHANQTVSHH